jgi:hypothetical protein
MIGDGRNRVSEKSMHRRTARRGHEAAMAMVLALLAFAVGCQDAPQDAGPRPSPTTGDEGPSLPERYTNDQAGFTLDYPSAWTAEEVTDQPGVLIALFQRQSAGDGFAENVNVLLEELPSGVTLDQYTAANKANLERAFTNFEVLEEEPQNIGEAPAFWIRYDAEQQGQRLSFLQAWLVDGSRAFVLSYTGRADEFEAYRPDAEAIFSSFRLT